MWTRSSWWNVSDFLSSYQQPFPLQAQAGKVRKNVFIRSCCCDTGNCFCFISLHCKYDSVVKCLHLFILGFLVHPIECPSSSLWLPIMFANPCSGYASRICSRLPVSSGSSCSFHVRNPTLHLSSPFSHNTVKRCLKTVVEVHKISKHDGGCSSNFQHDRSNGNYGKRNARTCRN